VFGLLTFPAQRLWGVNCSVVKHGAPSDAEKALMAGDYAKAEELFRAAVSAHPEDTDALVGLVRTLLLEQKVLDADEAVHAAQGSVDATKPPRRLARVQPRCLL